MNVFEGYRISSNYGDRENPTSSDHEIKLHRGIDLVKGDKTAICAFVEGKVVYAHFGQAGTGYGGYGNVVAIKDKNGYTHLYAHMDSIAVRLGDTVVRGQCIGTQGSTGDSTGSHLHYEVRKNGWHTDVDPTAYLENYLKEEEEMGIEDSKKIEAYLSAAWGLAKTKAEKDEIHRLANVCRKASGQPLT